MTQARGRLPRVKGLKNTKRRVGVVPSLLVISSFYEASYCPYSPLDPCLLLYVQRQATLYHLFHYYTKRVALGELSLPLLSLCRKGRMFRRRKTEPRGREM
jgi:hypothetical protein